nr:cytochrome P450 94C1-like [Ipomoea batatas]
MRLFPSVQFDSKFCLDDDTLSDDTFVRKGTRQPKEASQRGSNGVPSRQKEADDDISEQFIVVDDSHESREKIGLVGAVAAFPLSFDHLLRQFIDQTDSLAELLLGPDIQQSLDLPSTPLARPSWRAPPRVSTRGQRRRRTSTPAGTSSSTPDPSRKRICRYYQTRIAAEHPGSPLKRKEREQPRPNLGSHDLESVGANRHASARHLHSAETSTNLRRRRICCAQQIAQDGMEANCFPFGKLSNFVVDICRISSDNVAENMNVNGAGERFVEQTRIPLRLLCSIAQLDVK